MTRELNRPTLPLLPDLDGEAPLEEGLGRCTAGEDLLAVLAQTMDAQGDADGADILSGMHRKARSIAEDAGDAAWRGLLALVLLWDTWAETGATLSIRKVKGDTVLSAMVLAARRPADRRRPLQLVTLESGANCLSLGMAHPQLGIIPSANMPDLSAVLPARVSWYDRAKKAFADPSPLLNERDRAMLIHRLKLLDHDAPRRFASALLQQGLQSSRAVAAQDDRTLEALSLRALAVCGLQGFRGLNSETAAYAEGTASPLLAALGLNEPEVRETFPEQTVWFWQGKAFARSSMTLGFEPACVPEEEATLLEIGQVCGQLSASVAWQTQMVRRFSEWLMRNGAGRGFSPAAREHLLTVRRQAEAAACQPQETVTLHSTGSKPSEASAWLVREMLGDAFAEGGAAPFSDKLTLLPDAAPDVLGDQTLCTRCALPIEATGMPTWALPPLSAAMAKAVAEDPDALITESFEMAVTEMGEVQASFAMTGQGGKIVFSRCYGEEDIVLLQPEETPTVAVWPSVAFPKDQWRAYHVYTHGHGLTVSTLQNGAWVSDDQHMWSVVRAARFPACLTLQREGVTLGALVNQLPTFQPEQRENALIAIDLGMTGTTVALRLGETVMPMQLPCLVRTLLHGSQPAPFAQEFLPAEALEATLPSWAAVFRQEEPLTPLVDGHTGGAEQLSHVHAALKWSSEGTAHQAWRMHLHQVMMTAALCAKMNGAKDVAWRMTLPSDLSPVRRHEWMATVGELAAQVAQEACIPLTRAQESVTCVDEDQALVAYLRAAGYQRGGFVALDVGSSKASMMLWLRGMGRPCAVTHLPMGIHGMLLQTLLQRPDELESDFAGLADDEAREHVKVLAAQLRAARGSRRTLNRCMMLVDELFLQHGDAMQHCMNAAAAQGKMTLLQSLLLCGFAWLMTTAGLQLERAWQDPGVNDHLPQELPLCLCGRGGMLLMQLPDLLKMRLTRFIPLGMSRDHAVRQVYVISTGEPKMEAALGALRMTDGVAVWAADAQSMADTPLPMDAENVLRAFLRMFAGEFPAAAQCLWGDALTDSSIEQRAMALLQMHQEPSSSVLAHCLEELSGAELK